MLPAMEAGDRVDLLQIRPEQHFTEPPPRFTEATLVKALEEFGIGRPSTYATIISTLQEREYVGAGEEALHAHRRGPRGQQLPHRVLHALCGLRLHRPAGGRAGRRLPRRGGLGAAAGELLAALQGARRPHPGARQAQRRDPGAARRALPQVRRPPVHPARAQRPLHRLHQLPGVRLHPRPQRRQGRGRAPEVVEGRVCPDCGSPWRSSAASTASSSVAAPTPSAAHRAAGEPEDTGVACPQCGKGTLQKKKSRRGKIFYSCSTYPNATTRCGTSPSPSPAPTAAGRC